MPPPAWSEPGKVKTVLVWLPLTRKHPLPYRSQAAAFKNPALPLSRPARQLRARLAPVDWETERNMLSLPGILRHGTKHNVL